MPGPRPKYAITLTPEQEARLAHLSTCYMAPFATVQRAQIVLLAARHPELVRRLVALGLLEVTRDAQGRLWFDPSQVREMARIQRLRMSLNLGYSAIGLVVELLDRIAELERTQRRMSRRGGAPWT